VTAVVHNTGDRPLYLAWCDQPLQRYGLGEWHWVTRLPCAAVGSAPIAIEPGGRYEMPIRVDRAPAGEYRVSVSLGDGENDLPSERTTSAPFHLEPLPDAPQFVCPAESKADEAARIAREALEAAVAGRPTPDMRQHLLLESQVPGFGGLWLENSSLAVWLTDLARTDAMNAALRGMYGRSAVIVKKGDYSFSELVGWKVAVGDVFGILGVRSIDADELNNRVAIEISNELIRPDVECFVRGIGMPEGMALIERD
jgi:hypothetical protein